MSAYPALHCLIRSGEVAHQAAGTIGCRASAASSRGSVDTIGNNGKGLGRVAVEGLVPRIVTFSWHYPYAADRAVVHGASARMHRSNPAAAREFRGA